MPCKIRPRYLALTQWPRQFLHGATQLQIRNRFLSIVFLSLHWSLTAGHWDSQTDGSSLCTRLPGPSNLGCATKSKFPRRIRSLHCIETPASARLADILSQKEFNQGFSTFLQLFRFGSTLTFRYCLYNVTACGTYVSISLGIGPRTTRKGPRVSAANEQRCAFRA